MTQSIIGSVDGVKELNFVVLGGDVRSESFTFESWPNPFGEDRVEELFFKSGHKGQFGDILRFVIVVLPQMMLFSSTSHIHNFSNVNFFVRPIPQCWILDLGLYWFGL